MDIIGTIIYIVLFIIFIGAAGIIIYVGQDYFNYKSDSTYRIRTAINNTTDNNKKIVDTTIDLTDKINYSSSNMSNIMLSLNDSVSNNNVKINTIKDDNNSINSNINSFDVNLKRYFNFYDGDNNIGTNSETDNNNKIYNYLFSANDSKKLELINSTTAIAGMTINTTDDINSFKICDGNNADNCINMKNNLGNFIISPSNVNTSNIQFKSNGVDSIPALNIDLQNRVTYFNGNITDSSMYVNDSGVYVKNPINIFNVDNVTIAVNAASEALDASTNALTAKNITLEQVLIASSTELDASGNSKYTTIEKNTAKENASNAADNAELLSFKAYSAALKALEAATAEETINSTSQSAINARSSATAATTSASSARTHATEARTKFNTIPSTLSSV